MKSRHYNVYDDGSKWSMKPEVSDCFLYLVCGSGGFPILEGGSRETCSVVFTKKGPERKCAYSLIDNYWCKSITNYLIHSWNNRDTLFSWGNSHHSLSGAMSYTSVTTCFSEILLPIVTVWMWSEISIILSFIMRALTYVLWALR